MTFFEPKKLFDRSFIQFFFVFSFVIKCNLKPSRIDTKHVTFTFLLHSQLLLLPWDWSLFITIFGYVCKTVHVWIISMLGFLLSSFFLLLVLLQHRCHIMFYFLLYESPEKKHKTKVEVHVLGCLLARICFNVIQCLREFTSFDSVWCARVARNKINQL